MIKHVLLSICFFAIPFWGMAQYDVELQKVLTHYRTNKADSLKYKAALFLCENMSGLRSPVGNSLSIYRDKLKCLKKPFGIAPVTQAWEAAQKESLDKNISWVNDADSLNADFLIENIDEAFNAWKSAPWYNEISFKDFCCFILPYRALNERVIKGWRQVLREKYSLVIEGVTDIKQAFSLLADTVARAVRQTTPKCPYIMDALIIDEYQQASCAQQCVWLTAILRSLAIPATVDMVPLWANYSTVGHSWVSLVLNANETYTIYEKEKYPKRFNKIDASEFPVSYVPKEQDYFPFLIDSVKKAPKIYRSSYKLNEYYTDCNSTPSNIADKHINDVSNEYGFNTSITIPVDVNDSTLCLCVFRTGKNWEPVAVNKSKNNTITFSNVGANIIYVIGSYRNGRINPLTQPFLVGDDKAIHYFIPDCRSLETVKLYRKYPVFSNWSNQWGNMIGGTFEGANASDFSDAVVLDSIQAMPFGGTTMLIENKTPFRYLRYKTPQTSRTPLAELAFYTETPVGREKVIGVPIGFKITEEDLKYAFDGNRETLANTKSTKYWVGLDLGEGREQIVSCIKFIPKSDTNGVEPGHLYELFYFDRGWKSLGKQIATDDFIYYKDVPQSSILLLKDRTKGHEERIFFYNAGKQIWQ